MALFLVRRDAAIRLQLGANLHVLAYNLTRVINIIGTQPLIAAITA